TLASESDSKKVEIPYSVAKTLLESKIKELREVIEMVVRRHICKRYGIYHLWPAFQP
ncbi:hypothetical protein LCGC14_2279110, partial [marine sediment metagenome]